MRNFLLALAALALIAGPTDARGRRSLGGQKYSANGSFGLGLELGSPSGLNGKYFLSDSTALNFGIGWIYDRYYYHDRNGVNLYLDHLWHPLSLSNGPSVKIPLYIGVGGRLWNFNDYRDGADGTAIGVRVPLGIAFDFNNVPIDIFIQLTFVADLFFGYDCSRFANCDRFGPHFEGSVGVRYWFD
jgi:hypothetical protein